MLLILILAAVFLMWNKEKKDLDLPKKEQNQTGLTEKQQENGYVLPVEEKKRQQAEEEIKEAISTGKACLGIEFGSTRIKAVLIDVDKAPIASGTYDWENRYENHIWTYSEEDIWNGLQGCYQDLVKDVEEKYGEKITKLAGIGSANPITEESYLGDTVSTWNGRMGFWIRSNGQKGTAHIQTKTDTLAAELEIKVF